MTEARLYDFETAAAWLRVSESWLRKQVARRLVPHTRLGRNVRFTEADLEAISEAGHVAPTASAVTRNLRRKAGAA